jgi:GNAT superfamily N-acetyltransferase
LLRLEPIVDRLPDGLEDLRAEADFEDIRNIYRLINDWHSGAQRFTKPGELLLSGFENGTLVAIGGLTVEPEPALCAMRLRRLYVRPAWRKRGYGRALATALIEQGFTFVNLLTLNAGVSGASEFWEALGFFRVHAQNRTHELKRATRR